MELDQCGRCQALPAALTIAGTANERRCRPGDRRRSTVPLRSAGPAMVSPRPKGARRPRTQLFREEEPTVNDRPRSLRRLLAAVGTAAVTLFLAAPGAAMAAAPALPVPSGPCPQLPAGVDATTLGADQLAAYGL